MVDWISSGTPREPRRLLGSGLGRPGTAKTAAKEPQCSPKASQNGTNMGSIWGLKPVLNGIRFGVFKNIDFPLIFKSIFYEKVKFTFAKFCTNLVLGLTSSQKCNLHETP